MRPQLLTTHALEKFSYIMGLFVDEYTNEDWETTNDHLNLVSMREWHAGICETLRTLVEDITEDYQEAELYDKCSEALEAYIKHWENHMPM